MTSVLFSNILSRKLSESQVFLYEFFKDSVANYSHWRLVLQACGEAYLVKSTVECEGRYAVLCTEVCIRDLLYQLFPTTIS